MYPVKSGGFIIDTPGIRACGLVDLEKDHLSHYFPEMRDIMMHCKFNNCKHLKEPQCAVKEAVANEQIPGTRYDNYYKMMQDDENDIHRKNIYG
jgi:ribosome biogenesis GTPase